MRVVIGTYQNENQLAYKHGVCLSGRSSFGVLKQVQHDIRSFFRSQIFENAGHPYSLKQFNCMAIRLPADRRYYPDPVNLEWHGGNVFKGV